METFELMNYTIVALDLVQGYSNITNELLFEIEPTPLKAGGVVVQNGNKITGTNKMDVITVWEHGQMGRRLSSLKHSGTTGITIDNGVVLGGTIKSTEDINSKVFYGESENEIYVICTFIIQDINDARQYYMRLVMPKTMIFGGFNINSVEHLNIVTIPNSGINNAENTFWVMGAKGDCDAARCNKEELKSCGTVVRDNFTEEQLRFVPKCVNVDTKELLDIA